MARAWGVSTTNTPGGDVVFAWITPTSSAMRCRPLRLSIRRTVVAPSTSMTPTARDSRRMRELESVWSTSPARSERWGSDGEPAMVVARHSFVRGVMKQHRGDHDGDDRRGNRSQRPSRPATDDSDAAKVRHRRGGSIAAEERLEVLDIDIRGVGLAVAIPQIVVVHAALPPSASRSICIPR